MKQEKINLKMGVVIAHISTLRGSFDSFHWNSQDFLCQQLNYGLTSTDLRPMNVPNIGLPAETLHQKCKYDSLRLTKYDNVFRDL